MIFTRLALGLVALCALAFPGERWTVAADPAGSVVRDILSSTAQVVVVREGGARRSGSSVVVSTGEQGSLLVTAAHVLMPVEEQTIHAVTPLERTARPARLLAVDEEADLAILEVDSFEARPITFAAATILGDPILVASYPWGGRATVVSGMVSQIDPPQGEHDSGYPFEGPASLIDATVSHGMSGGGVYERVGGALVGIVRSHRSVKVTIPGEEERTITLPVAGETNVVSTRKILCFLTEAGYGDIMPAALRDGLTVTDCRLTN